MSPPRASCTSITSIRSLLIVAWTSPQRRRHSRPRKTQFRLILLSRLILRPGAVATLISLATTESPQKFCSSFGRLSFSCSSHGARRSTLDASARMARRYGGAFVFLLRSAPTFAAEASRARGLRTSADILTEHPPDIFTEQ